MEHGIREAGHGLSAAFDAEHQALVSALEAIMEGEAAETPSFKVARKVRDTSDDFSAASPGGGSRGVGF